jgi:hypothetical protein
MPGANLSTYRREAIPGARVLRKTTQRPKDGWLRNAWDIPLPAGD